MNLFRKITIVFLSLSFLIITNQNTIGYLYFKINQNYIAKNLCVQKDKEENLCLGNCYLKAIQKRLEKNSADSDSKNVPVKYNSSNQIQDFITTNKFTLYKKESISIFAFNKSNQLILKEYIPETPPPQTNLIFIST